VLHKRGSFYKTVLHWSKICGEREVIELLIEKGAVEDSGDHKK
jgi:ankyrin repeat protein